jgi:hypothetical protein
MRKDTAATPILMTAISRKRERKAGPWHRDVVVEQGDDEDRGGNGEARLAT